MFFDMQNHVQIAGRPAECTSFAVSSKTDTRAVFHSSWHFGFNRPLAQQAALTSALGTRIGDHAARALARRTCHRSLARRRAVAMTRFTSLMAPNLHFFFNAEDRLFKFQRQIFAKI